MIRTEKNLRTNQHDHLLILILVYDYNYELVVENVTWNQGRKSWGGMWAGGGGSPPKIKMNSFVGQN